MAEKSQHRLSLRREEGQALAEFALVLPILVLLLFGVIEFGKLFNYWLDEAHLANSGARWAVVDSLPGGATLQQYIRSQADTSELRSGAHVCISFPNGTQNVGDPVKVDVVYTSGVPIVSGLINTFFGGGSPASIRVAGSSTMRLESPPTKYTAGDGGTGAC
jgi:Flp pilus assembly protein TadG